MTDSLHHFSIPSNSGRETTIFEVVQMAGGTLDASVQLRTEFGHSGFPASSDLVPQYDVTLHHVLIEPHRLHALADAVSSWFENASPFESQLGTAQGQNLSLSIGPTESLISSSHHPVLRVAFGSPPTFEVEWSYVIDQSCLHILLEELNETLSTLSALKNSES